MLIECEQCEGNVKWLCGDVSCFWVFLFNLKLCGWLDDLVRHHRVQPDQLHGRPITHICQFISSSSFSILFTITRWFNWLSLFSLMIDSHPVGGRGRLSQRGIHCLFLFHLFLGKCSLECENAWDHDHVCWSGVLIMQWPFIQCELILFYFFSSSWSWGNKSPYFLPKGEWVQKWWFVLWRIVD